MSDREEGMGHILQCPSGMYVQPGSLFAAAIFCLSARISSNRSRDVPHDGHHADHLTVSSRIGTIVNSSEMPVPSFRMPWNGKDIAMAVPALPGRHDLTIALPVARSQPLLE